MSSQSVAPPFAEPVLGVAGVLHHLRLQPDGTLRFEDISGGSDALLEVSADRFSEMLKTRTLPLYATVGAAFYDGCERSVRAHEAWQAEFGYIGPQSGRLRWLRIETYPQGHTSATPYLTGVLSDVTPQKATEALARLAYDELLLHMENTPLAVIEWDDDFRVARWSGHAERMFGWRADEVLGKKSGEWQFVHEADAVQVRAVIDRLGQLSETRNISRNRNYTKSGDVRHCQWYNSMLFSRDGRIRSCLSLVMDVTETTKSIEDLARSEARLRTALRSAGMMGWDRALDETVVYSTEDYETFFGRKSQGASYEVVHDDDRPTAIAAVRRTIETGEPLHLLYRGAVAAADGSVRWFESRGQRLDLPDGSAHLVGVTADVTARQRAIEERDALNRTLVESQKYESLSLLAGGVAHDFNNLLTVIIGNAGLAQLDCPPESKGRERLDQVEAACQKAAHLCRQMLAFAGKARTAPRPLDLAVVVKDSTDMLHSIAGRTIHLTVTPKEVPIVRAEVQQVQQLLINLVANSAEAYGDLGGEVRIAMGTEVIDDTAGDLTPLVPAGRYVYVETADDGSGMTAEVRARMFDPFFSTKFTGRGLGLAAVLGIVKAHGGGIRVTTAPGAGTTLRIYFPTITSAPPPA